MHMKIILIKFEDIGRVIAPVSWQPKKSTHEKGIYSVYKVPQNQLKKIHVVTPTEKAVWCYIFSEGGLRGTTAKS